MSQLLTWVCVGEDVVDIIQGRYLIPIFPLLFMLMHHRKWARAQYVVFAVSMFSFVSLSYSSYIIYERYFIVEEVERTSVFSCDAEGVSNGSFITDSATVGLDNANTRSLDRARSGKYSAKVSAKSPYSFTYHLYQCKKGDSLIIDTYRWGKSGGIVISDTENNFHTYVDEPIEKDSVGWEHLQSKFMVPTYMKKKEVRMFIYYSEGSDASYFDDITITYQKLK